MDGHERSLGSLIERVRDAGSRQVSLEIRGGGTKSFYGRRPNGETLNVGAVCGISSYEPTELVVTVRGGTPLAELETELHRQGQCLPFEPPRFAPGGTVGGMVAAGLSGPARASVGSVRDHVLGLTLLDGRGELLAFGGQVAKNVAGYDLARLLPGSLGILGVICEVSLKVLPLAADTATLCFEENESGALQHFTRWASQPLCVNATSWHDGRVHVRLAGANAAVAAACRAIGGTRLDADAAMRWWTSVRDQGVDFFSPGAQHLADGERLWRLSVPATTAPLQLPGEQFIEWQGALRWWRTRADAAPVRDAAARAGGHATLFRGAHGHTEVFAPQSAVLMRIHRELKASFDPASVFNRGRLYAEL